MINQTRLINLLRKLVQINSENPPGNEFRIARFVQSYFRSLGLKTKLYEFEKNRSNVIAYMPHPKGSRSLLISPHLDTVPAGASWRKGPFSAKIERGRLYGLGATDCKCNLACAMEAMRSLIEDKVSLGYELIFAATADEESGSGLGLIPLIEKKILRPDAAVVLDADDFDIIITQKGLMHLKVKIQGRRDFLFQAAKDWKTAGHEIDPELDALLVSAIQDACEFDVLFIYDDIANRVTAMIAKCEGVEPTELIIRAIQGTLAKDGLEADEGLITEFSKVNAFLVEFIKSHVGDDQLRKDLIDGWLDSMAGELADLKDHLTLSQALVKAGGI